MKPGTHNKNPRNANCVGVSKTTWHAFAKNWKMGRLRAKARKNARARASHASGKAEHQGETPPQHIPALEKVAGMLCGSWWTVMLLL